MRACGAARDGVSDPTPGDPSLVSSSGESMLNELMFLVR
jgi:hypothetical protein